jgi:hypothetical protein
MQSPLLAKIGTSFAGRGDHSSLADRGIRSLRACVCVCVCVYPIRRAERTKCSSHPIATTSRSSAAEWRAAVDRKRTPLVPLCVPIEDSPVRSGVQQLPHLLQKYSASAATLCTPRQPPRDWRTAVRRSRRRLRFANVTGNNNSAHLNLS